MGKMYLNHMTSVTRNSAFFVWFTLLTVIFLFTASTLSSCKKEEPAKAVITVVDTLNNPIQGCTVELNSENNPRPGDVKASEITDISGNAYFEFELEAILQVEVSRGAFEADKENIHVIPGETAEKTITLIQR
jgi:hypothetical protein